MKTIYYYQTFVGLHKLLPHLTDIDVINVSSIHFDTDVNGSKNIYLNDNLPTAPKSYFFVEKNNFSINFCATSTLGA